MNTEAILAESRTEMIRQKLETELLNGALVPGQVLDERSLAERFGVSRTPVREAVLQLAAQGLLKVTPRVGVEVTKLGVQQLLSLMEMLAELEGVCAKFAATRMSPGERSNLEAAVKACEVATERGDSAAYVAANQVFHESIYAGSRNEWAASQIRFLRLRCAGYQQARFDLPGRRAQSLLEHREVMESILAGKGEDARLAMIGHIALGGRDLADFVSSLHPGLIEG